MVLLRQWFSNLSWSTPNSAHCVFLPHQSHVISTNQLISGACKTWSGCIRYRETYKMCSAGSTSWRGLRTTVLRHRCENPFSEVLFFRVWFSSVFEDEHIWLASTKWRKKMHQNMLTKLDFECFCCTCIDAFQNFKAEDYKSCYLWPFRNLHV